MNKKIPAHVWAILTIVLVIIADQALKIWVKTHFFIGEDLQITPWFHLKFIENNGMAFGMQLFSKILLTVGRIAAVCLLGWMLVKFCAARMRKGFLIAVALIVAGASGNIFDCVFYGEIFSNPYPPEVATLFPAGGGYAPWFEGRVVDMLYFPFFTFTWPGWVPFVGGQEYEFFQYIFNIADSAICVGVAMLILFYSKDASEGYRLLTGSNDEKSQKAEKQ